ncbi:MAG: diguanylate cyclase [Synergistaceae bacterium]|jgi:diguanylate cyclase (GGDEF)-like protein|nr:diguanylate cyclase [Synergistaceae bacterium]
MEFDLKNTILIVDDEKANLLALNEILSSDYSIFFAKTGERAIELAELNQPDLILLDVMMPDMDGFEVLAKLKASDNTRNTPVIFVTGLVDQSDEEKGFLLGAVDYIKKPFNGAIVKARVNTHMQIVRQLRASEELSRIDPLTGIPNRRKFNEHLALEWKQAIREQKSIAFLMIDIDKFKNYNDTYGHPQGDALLRAVARIFALAARRPADLVARLGGEEFGVLLLDSDLEGACIIAEKIRKDVEAARVATADRKILTSATVSIGVVSTVPGVDDSPEDFIAKADVNLYTAKETGRNRVWGPSQQTS